MDINSLLPLLLKDKQNGSNPNMQTILSAINNNSNDNNSSTADMLSGILGKQSDNSSNAIFDALAKNGGGNNNSLALINMLSGMQKNKNPKQKPHGLGIVKGFIPDDILGKIVKFFNK